MPVGVEDVVAMASCEVPEPVTLDGVSVAVAPDGRPLADSETLPLNPLRAVTVTVADPLLPFTTLSEEGATERAKS